MQKLAREDVDAADPALVANLQKAANLANENCERAMALAHKLSAQLRDAQKRINQLEIEGDGLVDRLTQAESVVGRLQSEADTRVDKITREMDQRIARLQAEAQDRVDRLQYELAQTKQRAQRAEQWLVEIRQHIETHLMPSLTSQELMTPEED